MCELYVCSHFAKDRLCTMGGGLGTICFVGVHFGVYIRRCHSDIVSGCSRW
jgi:hypothetical protein